MELGATPVVEAILLVVRLPEASVVYDVRYSVGVPAVRHYGDVIGVADDVPAL